MLIASIVIFALIAGIMVMLGSQLWARPKAAIDRVTAAAAGHATVQVAHPSLGWRELVKKLGSFVPSAPKDSTVMLRRLMRAGFRGPNALKMLYGSKVILGVVFPAVALVVSTRFHADGGM